MSEVPPLIVTVPFVPLVRAVMVSVLPSGSLSFSRGSKVMGWLRLVTIVSALAMGADCPWVTCMLIVAVALAPSLSAIV